MIGVVFIYYKTTYPASIQLLFATGLLSSLLIAVKGVQRYQIQLALGGLTLLAGLIMVVDSGLAMPYKILTILVGAFGVGLSIRSYLSRQKG